MKRKFLLFLTVICLVFTTVAQPLTFASAETTSTSPKIGDSVHGFTLTKVGYDTASKAMEYLFVHQKTGAKLLVLKNSDQNRGFTIKFNTPTDNDKGINHIIEHMVLSGSEKYPTTDLVFDLTNTTYSSFVNGFTSQNMTSYPVCSESEEQLLKSADTYLDAVYHPLFLSDERIFEREGWRYELASSSADLTYNGVVYNEMKGNLGDKEQVALANAQRAVFPGSNQRYNSGGVPDKIPTLTYKEAVATYKKNYQPSNSFMVLYGDVDYDAFLKMIDDNYLSTGKKQTVTIDRNTEPTFTKLIDKTYYYPVSDKDNTKNQSVIDVVFKLNDFNKLGFENYVGIDTIASLLNLDNSDIKIALQKSKIAESYKITLTPETFQPTLHFIAMNADPSKKKAFYNLVMKELKAIVKKGLNTELLNSSLRSIEFQKALGNESSTAVNTMMNVCVYDTLAGNSLYDYYDSYKSIVAKQKDKVLEKLIQKQIINCKNVALTATVPKKGLLENNDKAIKKTLAKVQSSMTKKQVSALVKKTSDFNVWNSQATPDDVLNSLKAVSLKDLTTEVRDRNIKETTIDGAKLMTADSDVDNVSSALLSFNVSQLTPEELLYLKFYSDMLGCGMATTNRTENQILNDVSSKAYSIIPSVTSFMSDKNDSSAYPVFSLKYFGFEDEYADTFDLVSDMLLQSKVTDITTYGPRAIANIMAQYQSTFADPVNLALIRSMAYTSPSFRYYNYLTGLDYYNFVISLEKELATDPDALAKKLEDVRTKAFNKNNLTIMFAGDASAQEKYKVSLPQFLQKLPDATYTKPVYFLPRPAKREAITINSTVQYVCTNGSLSANGITLSGKLNVISNLLTNLMLTPQIRLNGGAYGAGASVGYNNYYTYTYRDTNYVNSLATIGGTDEFLKTIVPYLTEDSLESYKLSAYAAATQSSGEITDTLQNLVDACQGITRQDKIDNLSELKSTSVADISTYSDYLAKLNDSMNYIVVAPASAIDSHKDMFDSVIELP